MLNLLKYLLLPPLANGLLILLGLALMLLNRRKAGWMLAATGAVTLLLLSLPTVSHKLQQPLETYPAITQEQLQQGEVLVVLGGGRAFSGVEYGWPDAPSREGISRLTHAAWLHQQSGLPLLLTGGRVHGETHSEAELMDWLLQASFGLKARWLEEQSRTTHENALYTAAILQQQAITQVVLVSHAWHLARAVPVFEAQGLTVIPAPLQFSTPPPGGLIRWIPRAYYLEKSTQALHEWLGRLVYRFY